MKRLLVFLGVFTLLIACNNTADKGLSEETFVGEAMKLPDMDMERSSVEAVPQNTTGLPEVQIAQQLIKTAYLTFETKSLDKTYQSIIKGLKENRGYIQNDNTSKRYDRITRTLLIRIPNKGFQSLIDTITNQVKVFDRKEISAKDVTEEFVDLEARLKAKRKLEERYLQLLTKAKKVSEMLEIERQISQIREEIEAKQGRLKYLQNQVSYSTLRVSFYELIPVQNAPSQTYLSRLWRAAKGGFHGIGNFVIGLVYVWPFILIGILGGVFIRKRIKKRAQKK